MSQAVIRVMRMGPPDGLAVVQFCANRNRRTVPADYGVTQYGEHEANTLYDAIERAAELGKGAALDFGALKTLTDWRTPGGIQVYEMRADRTTLRAFGFFEKGQGDYSAWDAYVMVRLETVKGGRRGKATMRRLRESILRRVDDVADLYRQGLEWLPSEGDESYG